MFGLRRNLSLMADRSPAGHEHVNRAGPLPFLLARMRRCEAVLLRFLWSAYGFPLQCVASRGFLAGFETPDAAAERVFESSFAGARYFPFCRACQALRCRRRRCGVRRRTPAILRTATLLLFYTVPSFADRVVVGGLGYGPALTAPVVPLAAGFGCGAGNTLRIQLLANGQYCGQSWRVSR